MIRVAYPTSKDGARTAAQTGSFATGIDTKVYDARGRISESIGSPRALGDVVSQVFGRRAYAVVFGDVPPEYVTARTPKSILVAAGAPFTNVSVRRVS